MRKHRILFFIFGMGLTVQAAADDIHVAAATNLTSVLEEIAGRFESETHHAVKLSFSSSGNIARQIIQGAPFELFMSADETYVSLLQERQLADDESKIFGIGRLVLYIPEGSAVSPGSDLSTLISDTHSGQLKRLAIANPEYAPYGLIAKQALQNARVWETVMSSLVYGKSASQATQFALSGAVDAALIPYSLTLIPEVSNKGRFVLVSGSLYAPLKQRMVLMINASDAAREFYNYILGDEARMIFNRHGLGLSALQDDQAVSGGY